MIPGEVGGKGLMLGIELVKDKKEPAVKEILRFLKILGRGDC